MHAHADWSIDRSMYIYMHVLYIIHKSAYVHACARVCKQGYRSIDRSINSWTKFRREKITNMYVYTGSCSRSFIFPTWNSHMHTHIHTISIYTYTYTLDRCMYVSTLYACTYTYTLHATRFTLHFPSTVYWSISPSFQYSCHASIPSCVWSAVVYALHEFTDTTPPSLDTCT